MKSVRDATDVAVLAALADPIRLQIVKRLARAREVAGTDLAKRLGISRALLCHHTGILVDAGIATRRKVGQTGYLRLNLQTLRRCIKRLEQRSLPRGPARTTAKRPPARRGGPGLAPMPAHSRTIRGHDF